MSSSFTQTFAPTVALLMLVASLAPASAAPDACVGDACEVMPLYFHVGGKMDGAPGARPAADPSTTYFSWNEARVVYSYADVPEAFTIPAGDSLRLVLFRNPAQENDYSTQVKIVVRSGQVGETVLDQTVGPVSVTPQSTDTRAATSQLAPLDPREGETGALVPEALDLDVEPVASAVASACAPTGPACSGDGLGTPDIGYKVPSAIRVAGRAAGYAYDDANAAADESMAAPEPAEAQVGWNDITLTLAEAVTVPAGASVEIQIVTLYEGSPVDSIPEPFQSRFDWSAFNRPEIVNRHDSEDAPARLEVTVLSA